MLSGDEGKQQEQLAGWLTDSLSPLGAYLNPEKHEPSRVKEFTDLILTYEGGTIILMSKTLAIFARETLPTRTKLAGNIVKKLRNDTKKIKNQCQKVHADERIFKQGTDERIAVDASKPIHAICLIPDLSLIDANEDYARTFLNDFSRDSGDFFHLLDTTQLFRVMQAAHLLSETTSTTPMEAFAFYLVLRHDFVLEQNIINFDMTLDARSVPARVGFHFSK